MIHVGTILKYSREPDRQKSFNKSLLKLYQCVVFSRNQDKSNKYVQLPVDQFVTFCAAGMPIILLVFTQRYAPNLGQSIKDLVGLVVEVGTHGEYIREYVYKKMLALSYHYVFKTLMDQTCICLLFEYISWKKHTFLMHVVQHNQ